MEVEETRLHCRKNGYNGRTTARCNGKVGVRPNELGDIRQTGMSRMDRTGMG
jgi:hypothetical protein